MLCKLNDKQGRWSPLFIGDRPRFAVWVFAVLLIGWLQATEWSAFAADYGSAATESRQTLMHDGATRNYVVRVPQASARNRERLPLVLVLHGGGGNAVISEQMTGFTEKAAKEGFIVVYPEGSGQFKGKILTWNAGHCCGYAMRNRINDVGFINTLIDRLLVDYPVDSGRIYATGISNGGMMSHRLGIELSERFAAIAPVVATMFGDERRPIHPVSALMLNGMLDKSVPYQGGPPGGRFPRAWDGTPAKPALEQAAFWASANSCASGPDQQDQGSFILWQYRCPAGKSVRLYLIKDDGHVWPGGQPGSPRGDRSGAALNATDVIWTFFQAHTK